MPRKLQIQMLYTDFQCHCGGKAFTGAIKVVWDHCAYERYQRVHYTEISPSLKKLNHARVLNRDLKYTLFQSMSIKGQLKKMVLVFNPSIPALRRQR